MVKIQLVHNRILTPAAEGIYYFGKKKKKVAKKLLKLSYF